MKNRYARSYWELLWGSLCWVAVAKTLLLQKMSMDRLRRSAKTVSQSKPGGGLGDTSSMPDLSGETQTITKTDGTIIKRQGMGGGSNDMNMPEGAGQPDMPEDAGQPDIPEGTEPPEKPDGDNSVEETEITLSDISEGDVIFVEFSEDASVSEITVLSSGMGMGKRPVDAQAEVPDSYDAVVEYTSDTEAAGKTLSSEGSTLTGAVTDDESYAGNGGDGYCRRMERLSGGEAVSIKVKDFLYYFQSV